MIPRLLTFLAVIILVLLLYNKYSQILQYNKAEKEKQSIISNLTYKEAEMLLSSSSMEENHILLNESLMSINNSVKLLEKISLNLSLIPSNINYTLPTFLKINTTNSSLNIAKSDIELYYSKYGQLSKKANQITESTYQSIKNATHYLNDIKKEISKIQSDFEIVSKNLCLPLVLNEKVINYTSTKLDDLIQNYKNSINELAELIKDCLNFCKDSLDNFIINIEYIYNNSKLVNTKIKEAYLKFKDIINSINEGNLHDILLLSKKSFTDLKSEMMENQKNFDSKYELFEYIYNNTNFDLKDFYKKYNENTEILKSTHNLIIEEIPKKDLNYSYNLNMPPIIIDGLINTIGVLVKQINNNQNKISFGIEEMINAINVEAKTSLDLLFIMDITGSMGTFLEEAKNNLINIINRIISECPGIDINLGFIGYRDIAEFSIGDYSDIDFTRDYIYVQEVIEGVFAYGGDDFPEDIAGAFELALNKKWKSNARFAILVADAPCHGEICYSDIYYGYDYYPNGVPGRKNITDLVEELAENQISLFCLRITTLTEKMFDMFKNIYKNHQNIQFYIGESDYYSEQKFSDAVIKSASKVYFNQRNNDVEYPNLRLQASYILNQLFGISYDFSLTLYEQEIIVSFFPKITVTLKESCDLEMREDGKFYYVEIENGLSLKGKGSLNISFVYEFLDGIFKFDNLFENNFKGIIKIGAMYIEFTSTELKIIFIFGFSRDNYNCEGSITISIELPKYSPFPEYAYIEEKVPDKNIFTLAEETFGRIITTVDSFSKNIVNWAVKIDEKVDSFLDTYLSPLINQGPTLSQSIPVLVTVGLLILKYGKYLIFA